MLSIPFSDQPMAKAKISLKFQWTIEPRGTMRVFSFVKASTAGAWRQQRVTQSDALFFPLLSARSLHEHLNQLDAITRVSPKHPEHRAPHYILIILFIVVRNTGALLVSLHGIVFSRRALWQGTFARLHAGYKVFSRGIKRKRTGKRGLRVKRWHTKGRGEKRRGRHSRG